MIDTVLEITHSEMDALRAACIAFHQTRRGSGSVALRGVCKCGASETFQGGPCSLYAKLAARVTENDHSRLATASPTTPRGAGVGRTAVQRGFYRHYKGPTYFVHGVGVLHDETRLVVVYDSTRSVIDGDLRLRYADEFLEIVNPRTGAGTRQTTLLSSHVPLGFLPRFARVTDD